MEEQEIKVDRDDFRNIVKKTAKDAGLTFKDYANARGIKHSSNISQRLVLNYFNAWERVKRPFIFFKCKVELHVTTDKGRKFILK